MLGKYELQIEPHEYEELKNNKVGLWQHRYNPTSKVIKFETNRPKDLAKYLEKHIDFGATTAHEVLGI